MLSHFLSQTSVLSGDSELHHLSIETWSCTEIGSSWEGLTYSLVNQRQPGVAPAMRQEAAFMASNENHAVLVLLSGVPLAW